MFATGPMPNVVNGHESNRSKPAIVGYREWRTPDTSWIQGLDSLLLPTGDPITSNDTIDALPSGFPKEIKSEMKWTGDDFKNNRNRYCLELSDPQVIEIEAACDHFTGRMR
jgi:hypothetical protein